MTEPDVAITDYLLCIESFWLAVLLWKSKSRNPTLRFWYSFVFFALTLPPFIGGTVHGFFNEHGSRGNHVLWPATLISLALAALALWGVAGVLFTFLAAAVQVFKISLHPRYFNFNSLYHLIQGAALYLIYVGARELTE